MILEYNWELGVGYIRHVNCRFINYSHTHPLFFPSAFLVWCEIKGLRNNIAIRFFFFNSGLRVSFIFLRGWVFVSESEFL
jgi:hypothetical protein